jgi:hypothetical protein
MEINKENIEITIGGENEVIMENTQQESTNSVQYIDEGYQSTVYMEEPKQELTQQEQQIKEMVLCCRRTASTIATILKMSVDEVNEILAK